MFLLDTTLVIALNHFTYNHPYLMFIAIFVAVYLAHALLAALLFFVFLEKYGMRQRIKVALVAFLAALTARYVIKSFIVIAYTLSRPYVALKDITLLIPPIITEEYQTFPSGHALFFFAMSTVLYAYNKKLGIIFYIASTLMGLARIMVGVHYPSDIIGGAIIGILVGFAFNKLFKRVSPL